MEYSSKTQPKKSSLNDLNSGVLEELHTVIADLRGNDDNNAGSNLSRDFTPLIKIFNKYGNLDQQLIQSWSYYSTINNFGKFNSTTNLIINLLSIINANLATLNSSTNIMVLKADSIINSILINNNKILYRGLNNLRTPTTTNTIRLMKILIIFNNFTHLENFINYFDFTLPSILKILTPNKNDLNDSVETSNKKKSSHILMRSKFLEFWITLITHSPSQIRKDLLIDNFKIMGNWFKFFDKIDSLEIIEKSLDCFVTSILKEPIFKKFTKTKILNEFALSKIHNFYKLFSDEKEFIKKLNNFFLIYATDSNFSVAFNDDCVWFDQSPLNKSSLLANTNDQLNEKYNSNSQNNFNNSSHNGALITINEKDFKVYNKLLFNVLRFFKPWEDDNQVTIVVAILNHVPELIPPYINLLNSQSNFDPKITSYWFGLNLTIGKIINLPIPKFIQMIETDQIPNTNLVIENIFPSILSKSSLIKCLTHDSLLIRQLTCQLLIFTFKKFELILSLYEKKGWENSKLLLSNSFFSNLPDLNIFVNCLNQSYTKNSSNKILVLSLTMILNYYNKFYPNFFVNSNFNLISSSKSSNPYIDIISKNHDNLTGLEFAILDYFLKFQEFNSHQTKWWNSNNDQNSLFSSLIKLASSKISNSALSLKISKLLSSLMSDTVLFSRSQSNIFTSFPQIDALINALEILELEESTTPDDSSKILKLLDEVISRCMKTPYKYVDMSNSYSNISPFVVALIEQFKFVEFSTNILPRFLLILIRSFVVIGEDYSGIKKALNEKLIANGVEFSKNDIDLYLNFENYENKLVELKKNEFHISKIDQISFFQYILLQSENEILKNTRHLITNFDSLAVLFRILLLVKGKTVSFDSKFKHCIDTLLSLLTSKALTDKTFVLVNSTFVPLLFDCILNDEGNEKAIFVSDSLIHIYLKLKEVDPFFESFVMKWLYSNLEFFKNKTTESTSLLLESIVRCFKTEEIVPFLVKNLDFPDKSLFLGLNKVLDTENTNIPFSLLEHLIKQHYEYPLGVVLSHFVSKGRVLDFIEDKYLEIVLADQKKITMLNSFLDSIFFLQSSIAQLLDKIDINQNITIAAIVSKYLHTNDDKTIEKFVSSTVNAVFSQFEKNNDILNDEYLSLFYSHSEILIADQQNTLLDYITSKYYHKYSKNVINLVNKYGLFDLQSIKIWLNELILSTTRHLTSNEEATEENLQIVNALSNLMEKCNFWSIVNRNLLNSQLEAIFNSKWVTNEDILEYVLKLALSGTRKTIESTKLLHLLFNNEFTVKNIHNEESTISFLTASLIYSLFHHDISKNSNITVQNVIVNYYNGSVSAKDRLLFRILQAIETKTSVSWTNRIFNWDLLEKQDSETLELLGEVKLISEKAAGLIVTLRSDYISNTSDHFPSVFPPIPKLSSNLGETWKALTLFEKQIKQSCTISSANIYDPYFILLLSLHNKELVSTATNGDGVVGFEFHTKRFISSGIFQIAVNSLSVQGDLQKISSIILSQMLGSLEKNHNFKDGTILRSLLKKIIFTVHQMEADVENKHTVAPVIWSFVARLVNQIVNPTYTLHEAAYRWVLNAPYIRTNEIPLLRDLMGMDTKQKFLENYSTQLSWVLEGLEQGIRTSDDIDLLKRKGVIEWFLNLKNLQNLTSRVSFLLDKILYNIQRIANGAPTLITRYAGLSSLEINSLTTSQALSRDKELVMKNKNNSTYLKSYLILEEQVLNSQELMQGYSIVASSQKRLRDWTAGDYSNVAKRLHK